MCDHTTVYVSSYYCIRAGECSKHRRCGSLHASYTPLTRLTRILHAYYTPPLKFVQECARSIGQRLAAEEAVQVVYCLLTHTHTHTHRPCVCCSAFTESRHLGAEEHQSRRALRTRKPHALRMRLPCLLRTRRLTAPRRNRKMNKSLSIFQTHRQTHTHTLSRSLRTHTHTHTQSKRHDKDDDNDDYDGKQLK